VTNKFMQSKFSCTRQQPANKKAQDSLEWIQDSGILGPKPRTHANIHIYFVAVTPSRVWVGCSVFCV